ncbi:MAG: cobalamin-dependent protein [Deltaproteobacteria bacterium]|nr:cobalamin-dependent protein [Deltaproteobacteria bacterium]
MSPPHGGDDDTRKRAAQPIRAYGDRMGDGAVQLSFTLPVAASARAKEAARRYAEGLGLKHVLVTAMEAAGREFSFFVVYGKSDIVIDYGVIEVPEVKSAERTPKEINDVIKKQLGRRVVVVGACTGSDAHTVGIDAILNMKGFAGDYGLERYPWFEAYNLGSQVPNDVLLQKAIDQRDDAILVSQVVTQRDVHRENSRHFIDEAKRRGVHGKQLLLLGGPRVDHKLALELGFDAGFGPGTKPSDVANFIVHRLLQRRGAPP